MLQTGLQQTLVPRMSQRASLDMHHLLQIIQATTLSQTPDQQTSLFSKGDSGLNSGAIL
jgi:hypothetical protein